MAYHLNKNSMKKISITIATTMLVIITTGFISYKTSTVKKINKNINVEVFKDASYNAPIYADAFATINITVIKVNGNKKDTAFTHNFAPMQLKSFPACNKPLTSKISVGNINDSKESLEVYYTLTYNTKGSQLVFSDVTLIGKGEQSGKLSIKI